jgi:hypothetical protein
MHFSTKNYLKSTRNHTAKQAFTFSFVAWCIVFFFFFFSFSFRDQTMLLYSISKKKTHPNQVF